METLSSLDLSDRSPVVQVAHRQLLGDLRHHSHRTDDLRTIKSGGPIGSGVIDPPVNGSSLNA